MASPNQVFISFEILARQVVTNFPPWYKYKKSGFSHEKYQFIWFSHEKFVFLLRNYFFYHEKYYFLWESFFFIMRNIIFIMRNIICMRNSFLIFEIFIFLEFLDAEYYKQKIAKKARNDFWEVCSTIWCFLMMLWGDLDSKVKMPYPSQYMNIVLEEGTRGGWMSNVVAFLKVFQRFQRAHSKVLSVWVFLDTKVPFRLRDIVILISASTIY